MAKTGRKNIDNRHPLLGIVGNIGVGKTTSAELLAQQLGFITIPENFITNPFLSLCYKEPQRWALTSQIFFLQQKVQQLSILDDLLKRTPVVLDCPLELDQIFALNLLQLDKMTPDEWNLYHALAMTLSNGIIKPDLLIHLDVYPREAQRRIRERGRDFETDISLDYLVGLDKAIEYWLAMQVNTIPLLRMDTNKLDLAHNAKHQRIFMQQVQQGLDALR